MENLPDNIDSKYRFIVLAAKRTAQLQIGAPIKVDDTEGQKLTTIAQEEVAQGLVNYRKIDEERSEFDIAKEAILGHDYIPDIED
jgi:DNA-directed RNA polymerase omega subunit